MDNSPFTITLLEAVNVAIRIEDIAGWLGSRFLPVQRKLVSLSNGLVAVDLGQMVAKMVLRGRELLESLPFTVKELLHRSSIELLLPHMDIDGARLETGVCELLVHPVHTTTIAAQNFVNILLVEQLLQAFCVVGHCPSLKSG